jgi:hypothetical protein
VFDSLKEDLWAYMGSEFRERFIISNSLDVYEPIPHVHIRHGHQYERAHEFDPHKSVIKTTDGGKYFIPSWGSYYVINVINRYKQERPHINAVRPIKHFVIHGLLFDTFFTLRFLLSNIHYYFMVRFWYYLKMKVKFSQVMKDLIHELTLFQDYETLTREHFSQNPKTKVLIVGHTHNPTFRLYNDQTIFMNTGTWTRMINLDLSQRDTDNILPYARLAVKNTEYDQDNLNEHVEVDLRTWLGIRHQPWQEYI